MNALTQMLMGLTDAATGAADAAATDAAAATATAGVGEMLGMILPLVLMFVVFYFLLIRPQKKRDKEVQKMRENIEIADEIVTIGGIIGRIVSIKDDTIVIETAGDRSKIRLARWSIQQNITATERAAQEQAANKENKK